MSKKSANKRSRGNGTQKPLVIFIKGNGFDVEVQATTKRIVQFLEPLRDLLQRYHERENGHDFDVVKRVVAHADLPVLEAFSALFADELKRRKSAS